MLYNKNKFKPPKAGGYAELCGEAKKARPKLCIKINKKTLILLEIVHKKHRKTPMIE